MIAHLLIPIIGEKMVEGPFSEEKRRRCMAQV